MEAVKSTAGNSGNFSTYLTFPGAVHIYDAVNLAGLAMVEAKSTKGSVYKADIAKIGDGVPGGDGAAPSVRASKESRRGSRSGTIGPGGADQASTPTTTRPGSFQVDRYTTNGS